MITYLTTWINRFYERSPWTNVVGCARSVLAMGTLLTLLTNSAHTLFPQSTQLTQQGASDIVYISMFHWLGAYPEPARWLAIAGLFLVVSGWRPRFTCLLHWYITFSFFASCTIIDGGDHLASVLSLLLIPVCLTDSRKWHWQAAPQASQTAPVLLAVAWVFILLIRCQASLVYLHAGVAKVGVQEWVDGTAAYYWTTHHYHGVANWLKPFVWEIMSSAWGVSLVSWGTIILELILFSALMIPSKDPRRRWLLFIGIAFHFSIVLVHGLISFFCSMTAILILYLRPVYQPFAWQRVTQLWKRKDATVARPVPEMETASVLKAGA